MPAPKARASLFRIPVVAVTSRLPGDALESLSGAAKIRVYKGNSPLSEDGVIDHLRAADAAITLLRDPVTRRVLESCRNLKVVANYAVGYDNIDISAAQELSIAVTNTPGVLTEATADTTWALILAASRRVLEGDKMVRAGRFKGWAPELLLGVDLCGKALGIVGMGRIGRAVARRGAGFGMRVLYCSPERLPESAESALCARYLGLDDLLAISDIVTLHCPLNDGTRHMIGPSRLAAMKRGAVLINTSRGPIVDEVALAGALSSGHLFAAGLDVYEREPAVEESLLCLPNVVLLPHIGSAGRETREAMARIAVANVAEVLAGRPPLNPVSQ